MSAFAISVRAEEDAIETVVAEAFSRNVNVPDIETDADHNRSVLTFVESPDAAREAALAVSARAIELRNAFFAAIAYRPTQKPWLPAFLAWSPD